MMILEEEKFLDEAWYVDVFTVNNIMKDFYIDINLTPHIYIYL